MQVNLMLTLLFIRNKKLLPEFILPAIALLTLFLFYLKDYFLFSASSIFGILLLPYTIHIRKPEKKSIRFLFIMLFFILLACLSPLNTLIYLAWISALLLLIENSFGKISLLGFIYLISISPIFNYFGNLFRIILLVLFHIPAENSMHDLLGLICLIVYVLIPLWYTARFFYTKLSFSQKNEPAVESKKHALLLNIMSIVVFSIAGHFIKIKIKEISFLPALCSIDGYKKSLATKDVIQFEDSNTLIYVKPVNSFYGAEHTRMICWVGSGYSFKQVKKIVLHNKELFIGKLTKGKDVIYCSWWFDNGTHKTINQLEWRWNVLTGSKPYSLINVNTTDEKELYLKTDEIISKNIFIKK